MSQAQMAEALGEVRPTIGRWESGKTTPTIDQMNAIAALLPVSVEQLLRAYGARLVVPVEAHIPRSLLDDLANLDAESLQVVARVARALRQPPAP